MKNLKIPNCLISRVDLRIVAVLALQPLLSVADTLSDWQRSTDQGTKFILARKIVSQWPGSTAADLVSGAVFGDTRYSDDQKFIIAWLYFEGLNAIGQNGKYVSQARTLLGVPNGTNEILPASLAGQEDSGNFTIYSGDDQIGSVSFTLQMTGAYQSSWEETLTGIRQAMKTAIDVDANGYWVKITRSISSPTSSNSTITREGFRWSGTTAAGNPVTGIVLPNAVLFDTVANPALFSFLARQYDPAKGGVQRVPIMTPMMSIPVRASVERTDIVTLQGQSGEFTKYSVRSYLPVPTTFWTDASAHTVLVTVPGPGPGGVQSFVRLGFEELLGR